MDHIIFTIESLYRQYGTARSPSTKTNTLDTLPHRCLSMQMCRRCRHHRRRLYVLTYIVHSPIKMATNCFGLHEDIAVIMYVVVIIMLRLCAASTSRIGIADSAQLHTNSHNNNKPHVICHVLNHFHMCKSPTSVPTCLLQVYTVCVCVCSSSLHITFLTLTPKDPSEQK